MAILKINDSAPVFQAVNQHGETVKLSDFQGRKLVVYFFPKANTSG